MLSPLSIYIKSSIDPRDDYLYNVIRSLDINA